MIRYILKRILWVLPVLLVISLIIFTMLYFSPGDPTTILLPPDADDAQREILRQRLGLDQPFWVQYGNYVRNIITRFDFGISWVTHQPVTVELLQRFPFSVRLALLSAAVATVFGIILGIISAVRQYTIFDNGSTVLGLVAFSMPNFWLGMLLLILFSVRLRWFPVAGVGTWLGWVLPSITIGFSSMAHIMRMTRSSMLEVMRQDYITTARAKGLHEYVVIWKHALGNASIPILTTIGLTFAGTMGGAIVTERVFGIPGIGMLIVDAINDRNFPVVQGVVLLTALAFCLVNLLVDIVYAFIDPRIKTQYMKSKGKVTAKETAK
ncbi:MAG: ABC transporter permease [Treponema sp.]|nr:ABC transporter permease [Treponema sp.]